MKKFFNTFLSLFIVIACAFTCIAVSGCSPDEPPASSYYHVTFDEDNNALTTNITKDIKKAEINNRSAYPTLADDNATNFCREWVLSKTNGDNLTFIASTGDGTSAKPFLINKVSQIQNINNTYGTKTTTEFYNAENLEVSEAEALKKVDVYPGIKILYSRASTTAKWSRTGVEVTSTVYVRLISDIDLTTAEDYIPAETISVNLDGASHNYKGENNGIYTVSLDYDSSTYLFDYVEGSTIKNLNLNLPNKSAGLTSATRSGIRFENITVNSERNFVEVDSSYGNYSPFISYVLGTAKANFVNCTNNANFMSGSKNMAIFVGGYGTLDTELSFDNCVNNGDVIATTAAGMFIGNRTYNPTINITNCKNTGDFRSKRESHILAGNITANTTNWIPDEDLDNYDTSIAGVIENTGTFTLMTTSYTASISGKDVTISNSTNNLAAATYEFQIRTFFHNWNGGTLYVTASKTLSCDGSTKTLTFDDVNLLVTDTKTFVEKGFSIPQEPEWIESGSFKYFVDAESGYYVFDVTGSGFEEHPVHTTNAIVKTIIVRDASGNIIDFVVDVK